MRSPTLAEDDRRHVSHRQDIPTSLSLLGRLRLRDQEAWRNFLMLYAPLVTRWCRWRGLTEADTADVARDVFRKVIQYLPQFRKETPEDNFRGWLCRITHCEIARLFRSRDRAAIDPRGGSEAMMQLQQHPDRASAEADEEVRQETRYLYHKAVALVRGEFPIWPGRCSGVWRWMVTRRRRWRRSWPRRRRRCGRRSRASCIG